MAKVAEADTDQPMAETKQTKPKFDIDLRLATMRHQCVMTAIEIYKVNQDNTATVLDRANEIYDFVLNGKLPTKQEWK